MTQNPYAAPSDFGPDYYPEQRTSIMAILSLVFSLVCCIPGTGLVGLVLGIAAVVAIASAQGRLAGRGMAVAGIVIGLFTTVLWLAVAFGAVSLLGQMNVYGDAVEDMQAGRVGEARTVLSAPTSASLTDEQIVAFGQEITQEWGAYQGMPGGLFDWLGAYATEIGQTIGSTQPAAQSAYTDLIPVPIRFDNGTTVVWIAISKDANPGQTMPAAVNMGFVDKGGQIVWLADLGVRPPSRQGGNALPPAPAGDGADAGVDPGEADGGDGPAGDEGE